MKLKSQKIFIRVDVNSSTGSGHFMRCLALAQAWKKQGDKVTFISSCESESLRNRITDEGFELVLIKESCTTHADFEITLSTINNLHSNNSWVILDGYHFDTDYQQSIKNNGNPLVVIDDIAHLDHYVADIILNQNINAEELSYSCEPRTKLLLGTDFVLLRDEFLSYNNWKREFPKVANKILVTMGGSDQKNITFKVLEAINQINIEGLEIKVVIGSSNRHLNTLKETTRNSKHSVELLQNVLNMPDLMVWADLAVSGGGSTCWELAFAGVPIIIVELAENQKYVAKALDKNNIAINLGWYSEVTYKKIQNAIKMIIGSEAKRKMMGVCGRDLINGQGKYKVLNEIYN